jgi:thiosulfate/3-mercaptopyruvate sulfurtransferase
MSGAPATSPLVNAHELVRIIGSPSLLLVDCRFELGKPAWGLGAYEDAHIPGAVYAHLDAALSGPKCAGSGRHPLPTAAAFARTLGGWGYSPSLRVVAYDQGHGAYAARLWWMLRARGHAAVQVLDGGYAAWLAAGYSVNVRTPDIAPTQVAAPEFAGAVSTQEVAAGLANGSITVVDARGADRFAGRNETIDPVAGHVPGAVNHPFTTNLSTVQHFLDADELKRRWSPILTRAERAPIVAMCGSGVTACHNLVALELAGYRGARLYAGSFSEWITDPLRHVATGEYGREF